MRLDSHAYPTIAVLLLAGCKTQGMSPSKLEVPTRIESDQLAIERGKFGMADDASTLPKTPISIWNPSSQFGINAVIFPAGSSKVRYNLNYADEAGVGVLSKIEKRNGKIEMRWFVKLSYSKATSGNVKAGTLMNWLHRQGLKVESNTRTSAPSELSVEQELACYYTSVTAPYTSIYFIKKDGEPLLASNLTADANWPYNSSPLPTSSEEREFLKRK